MQRLKTRSQFQAVLAGSVVAKTAHFSLHCNELHAQTPRADLEKGTGSESRVAALFPVHSVWMGAMVPKRWAKRAVTRNAIKRQIYTVSADFFHICPQVAFVIRLRKEFSRQEFSSATSSHLKEAVRAEVITLMKVGCGPR